MATINRETMDNRQLTPYFVQMSNGALRQLPYYLVTIDFDWQAYMPVDLSYHDSNNRRIRGTLTPPVILQRDSALPLPTPNTKNPDAFGVFEYHGI